MEIRTKGRLVRIGYFDGEGYQFLQDPETTVRMLRNSSMRIDLLTFIQKLSESSPKYSYPMEWENLAAIRVSSFDHWMSRQLDSKSRNMIRKAAKNGLITREVPFDDDLIRGISAIYNETPIRQGRRFAHYQKDFKTVRKMKATFLDRSIFIGAFFEGNLVGFAKLVYDEGHEQAGLMHILSMIRHRSKAPMNALIAQAVKSCSDRSISYLWYGQSSYGNKQRDSLWDFKRHNGFERIETPRYYIPLTTVGSMALRLGLHHSISDWIPEPVIAAYLRVRSHWYAKKFANLETT